MEILQQILDQKLSLGPMRDSSGRREAVLSPVLQLGVNSQPQMAFGEVGGACHLISGE